MKCSFVFSNLFLGGLLIAIGASIILKAVFNIDIPVFRTVLALGLIAWGISMLTGSHRKYQYKEYTYSAQYDSDSCITYNIGFGNKDIDLTDVTVFPSDIFINSSFGSVNVIIPQDKAVLISVNAVSSGVKLPNGDTVSFGHYTYKTNPHAQAYDIHVHANSFCGSLKFKTR